MGTLLEKSRYSQMGLPSADASAKEQAALIAPSCPFLNRFLHATLVFRMELEAIESTASIDRRDTHLP
jgi:hypothetical protein